MAEKPSYRTSKQALWLSSALAWVVLLILTIGAVLGSDQAVGLAAIAFPSMVGLIVLLLGVHRGLGSLDMWTMTRAATSPQPAPPNHLSDEPAGGFP